MTEAGSRPTEAEARLTHHEPIVRNCQDYEPEMGRFNNTTQMVFHPTSDHPLRPNTGILTYNPGAGFPLHKHDFAQVWYILEGSCQFGANTLRVGDIVYMEDPHYECDMHTEEGCKILFLQYPGPTTGGRPVYEGRFNMEAVKPIVGEDLEH